MISTIFLSTFLTILIAELGDKTQLATLTISGSSNRPFAVFLGSSLALVLATLIGVLLGSSFSQLIPVTIVKLSAALGFFLIGATLLLSQNDITDNENQDIAP